MFRFGFFTSSAIWETALPPDSEDASTPTAAAKLVSFTPGLKISPSVSLEVSMLGMPTKI